MTKKSLLSALTIATIGLGSKAFLKYVCADAKVVGLSRLLDELERAQNRKGKGVMTSTWFSIIRREKRAHDTALKFQTTFRCTCGSQAVAANPHDTSDRLDDPLMWGILPASHYTRARPMRWSLGASDICFTNP
jgi:monolysocardiolipin acyltransferase